MPGVQVRSLVRELRGHVPVSQKKKKKKPKQKKKKKKRLKTQIYISPKKTYSDGKEYACSAGDLGMEDPLEKEMATHSSILAGEFHGQGNLAGYSL